MDWYIAVKSSKLRDDELAPRPRVLTDREASDDTGITSMMYDLGWVLCKQVYPRLAYVDSSTLDKISSARWGVNRVCTSFLVRASEKGVLGCHTG